jgi:hypothetical protein
MPRIIDVLLKKIKCNANGFGGTIQVSGEVFGELFQNDPNNPAESRGRTDIFPFPHGPITFTEGQTVEVTMKSARFSLWHEAAEPSALVPHFLTIGGTLSLGLGSKFFTIPHTEFLPFLPPNGHGDVDPALRDLEYSSANVKITLTFGLAVAQVF